MSNIETETVEDIKLAMASEIKDEPIENEEGIEEDSKLSYKERIDNAYQELEEDDKVAWAQGWRPKEFDKGKYRDGTDRPWLTAKQFLDKSKNNAPIANERIRELSKRIEKAEQDAREARERIERAEQKGYDKALEEISKKQREAVEIGDVEIFDDLRKQEFDLISSRTGTSNEKPVVKDIINKDLVEDQKKPFTHKEEETLRNWQADNQWMSTDPKLAAYAIETEKELLKTSPYLSLSERLELVEQEVKETFHKKFNNQSGSQMFGSGGNGGYGQTKSSKGYSELDARTKNNCDQVMEMRGIKSQGEKAVKEFRQSFAKAHFAMN